MFDAPALQSRIHLRDVKEKWCTSGGYGLRTAGRCHSNPPCGRVYTYMIHHVVCILLDYFVKSSDSLVCAYACVDEDRSIDAESRLSL